MNTSALLPAVLLVESQFVLRRTIVSVAQRLGVAHITEATNHSSARRQLESQRFDGIVVDMSSVNAPFDLISQLRRGEFASDRDTPVVAMAPEASDPADGGSLAEDGSLTVLIKPFKVTELLKLIEGMPRPAAPTAQQA